MKVKGIGSFTENMSEYTNVFLFSVNKYLLVQNSSCPRKTGLITSDLI